MLNRNTEGKVGQVETVQNPYDPGFQLSQCSDFHYTPKGPHLGLLNVFKCFIVTDSINRDSNPTHATTIWFSLVQCTWTVSCEWKPGIKFHSNFFFFFGKNVFLKCYQIEH